MTSAQASAQAAQVGSRGASARSADVHAGGRKNRGLTLEDYAASRRLPVAFLREIGMRTVTPFGKPPHIAIDYRDEHGNVVFTKYRGAGRVKFWSDPGATPTLYGLDRLAGADSGRAVLICEGESDCHVSWLHHVLAIGAPGASSWRSEWASLLTGRPGWIWQEPDRAGELFVQRIARDLVGLRVIHSPQGVKDLSDLHVNDPGAFPERLAELAASATDPPPVETTSHPHGRQQKGQKSVRRRSGHRRGCTCARCTLDPRSYHRRRHDRLPVEAARAVPILDIAEHLGLELRRVGGSWRGRCPLHGGSNTSSFSIVEDGGATCFSCGWSGDAIALVMAVRGVEFADAVKQIAGGR